MRIKTFKLGDEGKIQEDVMSLEILTPDGQRLFSISTEDDTTLRVSGGDVCFTDRGTLGEQIQISPVASNVIHVTKERRGV